jgi:hypothetical protein
MKKIFKHAISYGVLMSLSMSTSAALVRYNFNGVITAVSDGFDLIESANINPIQSTFDGYFIYDDEVRPGVVPERSSSYAITQFFVEIDDSFYIDNVSGGGIGVSNDTQTWGDLVNVTSTNNSTNLPNIVRLNNQILFSELSSSLFSEYPEIPTPLSLDDFDSAELLIKGWDVVSPVSGDSWFSIVGVVTNLEVAPVPVPAAIWLFGSGFIGLASFARRNKN